MNLIIWIALGIVELLLIGLIRRGISNTNGTGEEAMTGMMQCFGGAILFVLFNLFLLIPWLLHR